MGKSIIQQDSTYCFLCGRNGYLDRLEKHHVFFGTKDRKKADEDGLIVWLCGERCHRNGPQSAHRSEMTRKLLQRMGQRAWESNYGNREEFMKRYGKNYC